MTRLTRAEQQRLTHERLLEAGRSVLTRRGFLAATVDEIAEEAGYTRGAVYKHFGGKEGLWQALVDAHAEAHLQLLGETLDRASTREELIAALTPAGFTDDQEAARWSTAAAEFMAAVTRQPEAAAGAVAAQRRHEEQIEALLERHCLRLRIRPAMPLRQVVVALGAMGGSLALRRGVDPATDVSAIAANVLAVMFPEPQE
ncbi:MULTISPECIES: helix-turn-helix domain-containing protein [unclassified Streptomyces]|uniref:TetR/AcrR family transcriptional regulator n=1 Tax=unclassified Streptomyces TaxID=2593676 RepID=UPI002DDBED72|nr:MULTISPECIES: helix-turn-helix domain-containing protein [unclassified Streptomyces]WSA90168.1 TetR/AcrR family transcriptional regulator [Streptomyces sp. NBC_01795]WSB74396.1 TetR/AcrR family transcriptional regulator [Streptomyces sp. NBC_01775]WSS17222.1 TetR/AcrR family transcriptional regulator [Streptomyces sp. NBC_01186]WSS45966.1 TetR/AcrR family transcriptional regulator [Streptomyces sp. NBC_01187]